MRKHMHGPLINNSNSECVFLYVCVHAFLACHQSGQDNLSGPRGLIKNIAGAVYECALMLRKHVFQ